ncbi:hypothetical protein Tco_0469263 [Tanacetum coccineum]
MSSSTITYTSVYSYSKPWRFQWVSDEEPEAPEEAPQSLEQAPPSPEYVPGPKNPPSPDYIPGSEAAKIRSRSASPLPVPSPPSLLPSTAYRDDIPEADMPLQKRARFSTHPRFRGLSRENSAACLPQGNASIRASKSRAMTAIGEVNKRVTDLSITQREGRYFRLMASFYEREAVIARQAWSRSKDRSTALEATIRAQEARTAAL